MSVPLDDRLPLLAHPPHPALLIMLDEIGVRYGACGHAKGAHWLLTEPLTPHQRACLAELQTTIASTSQRQQQGECS